MVYVRRIVKPEIACVQLNIETVVLRIMQLARHDLRASLVIFGSIAGRAMPETESLDVRTMEAKGEACGMGAAHR
jgi:hypothetical protein